MPLACAVFPIAILVDCEAVLLYPKAKLLLPDAVELYPPAKALLPEAVLFFPTVEAFVPLAFPPSHCTQSLFWADPVNVHPIYSMQKRIDIFNVFIIIK